MFIIDILMRQTNHRNNELDNRLVVPQQLGTLNKLRRGSIGVAPS